MIEHYTPKFTPAASPKEVTKQVQESKGSYDAQLAKLHHTKARIELLRDPADMKKTHELPKELS
jgi:hypothetical protein